MRYSCFRAERGTYDYFEDGQQRAINADLPVPRFPSPTKLGVAAIEAGRPLPIGARRIGSGWHPQGIITRCPGESFGSAPSVVDDAWSWTKDGGWKWIAAGAVAAFVLTR